MTEKRAESLYNKILHKIVIPEVGGKTTYSNDLEKAGIKLLGLKFVGVFPSDKIPPINNLKKYVILNLDKSTDAGSHWVAVAHNDRKLYLYDSFGRKGSKIIPSLFSSGNGVVVDTDPDPEQDIRETNCGARCIAFLMFFERYGHKNAMLI